MGFSNCCFIAPMCILSLRSIMKTRKEEIVKTKTKKGESHNADNTSFVSKKKQSEKKLYSWTAPSRPFKRRGREFWVTILAISAVASLVLFIIEGAVSVILVIAILFLFYILSTVRPDEIEYSLTNYGIKIAGKTSRWETINRYWFTERLGTDLLIFETQFLPGRLELVIRSSDKERLDEALDDYVLKEEAPATNLDKASTWLSNKLPRN